MRFNRLNARLSGFLRLAVCLAGIAVFSGCADYYSKRTPEYNLVSNQDKKVLIWVDASRSSYADADAPDAVAGAIGNHLLARAGIKPHNIIYRDEAMRAGGPLPESPEAAARQVGAQLVLMVQIEDYELLSMRIRNFYSGRMMTRSLLLDVQTGQAVWPSSGVGKVHDIVIELGEGNRRRMLSRMADSTAHCILRNLYPIGKNQYRNSDERMSFQEAFEMETF